MYNSVRVCIIIGHVTDSIHSTVQIPVTSHTAVMHTSQMNVMWFGTLILMMMKVSWTHLLLDRKNKHEPQKLSVVNKSD